MGIKENIEQILQADFSNEDPQQVFGKAPMPFPEETDMPRSEPSMEMQQAPIDAPPEDMDARRAKFEELMASFSQRPQSDPLAGMQVSNANPQAPAQQGSPLELGNIGNMDEAIAQRNEQQRKAQLLRGFSKIMQGGATMAGGKISDGSELYDAMEKNAGQPVDDIKMKQGMQQGQQKQEMVMKQLQMQLDKSNLDFQNEQAINDPSSPQSQFVQDQFMMMQQAMGKPVNEQAIRQQTSKTLYEVSPWMQKVYANQLKGKMERERLNMQNERLNQGRERLDLLTNKEGRLGTQFNKRMDEKQEDQSTSVVKDFEKDGVVKKSNESIGQADNVIQLVTSDNPIGHAAIPTFMARAAGEVGNLSEGDKAPFGGSQALKSRLAQVMQTYKNGELTPENQQFVIELANVMKRSAKRNKAKRAIDLRPKYAKSYNMELKDVNDLMVPELNQLDEEDAQAVEWALANPTKPQAAQILKMHGY